MMLVGVGLGVWIYHLEFLQLSKGMLRTTSDLISCYSFVFDLVH